MRYELKGAGKIVLTRGLDGGVWGFDIKRWEKEARRELQIPVTEEKGRVLRRVMFSGAEVVDLDKQGRFVVPTALLLQLGKAPDCTLIGAGDHFEIWDFRQWEKAFRSGLIR